MDPTYSIFSYIVSAVETPLLVTIGSVTDAFVAYVSTPLRVLAVLYLIVTAVLLVRGELREPGEILLGRFVKLALVIFALTGAGVYQQYVTNLFLVTLPNSLAAALQGAGAAALDARQFDQVWLDAWTAGLEVWKTLDLTDVSEKLMVALFWLAAILSTIVAFAIWQVSRLILALLVAIGPLLIPSALFGPTRSLFERWIGAMIGCIVLQVTVTTLLYIVLSVELSVVGQVVATGGTDDPMSMIRIMLSGVIFFAIAAYVALQLPALASSIAGGLHFHAGALMRGMRDAIGSSGRTYTDAAGNTTRIGRTGMVGAGQFAASGAYAGGRAVAEWGRQVFQRMRPPPGGSLSAGR